MERIFGDSRRRELGRRGVTSVEYGLTAALVASMIIFISMSLQGVLAAQTTNRCFPIAAVLEHQKL